MIVWHPNCRILLHLFPLSSAMLAYFHSHSRKKYNQNHHFFQKETILQFIPYFPQNLANSGTVIIKQKYGNSLLQPSYVLKQNTGQFNVPVMKDSKQQFKEALKTFRYRDVKLYPMSAAYTSCLQKQIYEQFWLIYPHFLAQALSHLINSNYSKRPAYRI